MILSDVARSERIADMRCAVAYYAVGMQYKARAAIHHNV